MSSPERDKHLTALANLEAFCEAHNEKTKLVEQIQGLLFKCDVRYLRRALRDLKDYIKDKK
ncbi:hypothetical protein B9N60_10025 [Campylobacter concisus]|uniref:Uncharacterized protein n=1 Tax=Campylobacter concisus TaxID=199 RepID=A0A1Y5N9J8_9BACT|nr:hypothetical protein B9N60_10025 [Campylobacter concisus]